jgi:hypothetical protein
MRIKLTPRTQPTCGLALKVNAIEPNKISEVGKVILLLKWMMKRKIVKVKISQNSAALSLKAKFDHRKWLGMNANTQIRRTTSLSLYLPIGSTEL